MPEHNTNQIKTQEAVIFRLLIKKSILKNFSFLLLQNMVRADVFLRVLLRF